MLISPLIQKSPFRVEQKSPFSRGGILTLEESTTIIRMDLLDFAFHSS